MATKGCWTCKDRKISCDRTVPKCLKCLKSKRTCGGYGMRLTWPQEDHSRALVGHLPSKQSALVCRESHHQWVNVAPTDVRLHLITSISISKAQEDVTRKQLAFPSIPESIPTRLSDTTTADSELLQYFETVVVDLLPMLCTDRTRLCRILLRVAVSKTGQSSRAVYHSILALASYHRGGDLLHVDQMKRSALRDLYTHMTPNMCDGLEHVAANLLLCILEMQQTFGDESCYIGFITGVKQVIDALKESDSTPGSDASVILGWLYHFDVMARFSFRHWRTEHVRAIAAALGYDSNGSYSCHVQYILARASFARGVPKIAAHAHPVARLIAEVSDTAMYSSEPKYLSPEYQQYLDDLRSRLENVAPHAASAGSSMEELSHTEQLLKITRLAGMIYLERISRNFSGHSTVIDSWTGQALSIIGRLESCLCPFALFIVACELDRDIDRMIILDLYARMEARPHLRSFMEIKFVIQTAWNLQDLAGGTELEYIQKLNIVLSSRDVIPSFI